VPKRGLGRAYMDAIPYIRGKWVIMGDADCTYDFRQIKPFVDSFREGYEYVMGSRWKGSIEAGSMPALHQHLGTPVTTWILNRLYGSRFSDIHCGMRGITRDALVTMDLQSQSWEYASEMVLKSVHMELRTAEVPVTFLKDRQGRLSHHKRSGWFSPWAAAWINLRAMFVYGSDFFVFKPGIALMILGLLLTVPVSFGDLDVGPVTLSLNWQFLGVAILIVGSQAFFLGCIAQVLFDYTGRRRRRWLRVFPYTRTVLIAFALVVLGVALAIPLVETYFNNDLRLQRADALENHLAVTGLAAVIMGVQLFIFTLLLHGTVVATSRGRPRG
jgi:Glycosyl transferase family 2